MNCPLCQYEHTDLFAQYENHALMQCSRCDLIYQTEQEQLDLPALVDGIYNVEWIQMRAAYAESTFLDHALFNTLLLDIMGQRKGTLLEIGSGTGEFALTAGNAGWQVTGIEPSSISCLYAKEKYGVTLRNGMWDPVICRDLEPFDAIAFWHVLEHIRDPLDFLTGLRDYIKPGGMLYFSIPNKNSFTNETYGPASPLYTERDHLYHYSSRSLRLTLGLAGYSVVSLFSRQLPHNLDPLIHAHPGYGHHSFENKAALLTKLQAQLRGHELCCVARIADS
ncbi:class I SAM-dependent methyltransferase [Paenibacillus sp. YIM B09110]|uniref:class I SAM-dependent methyltransferase n=1 Tax=Paenibacillus sp. YIM B09110 TaxID=3126102 RepID=UPI00301C2C3C